MSRILSRISMLTGQISSHALHDVHAQSSADVMRSNTESAVMVMPGAVLTGGDTAGAPVAAITSPTFSTISRGSSGLPVACAGHTDVHRPHTVQASVSKSCFQVKSSIVAAPNVSRSVSIRFGMGFIAPLGRSLSFRYMFIGDVIMCRSFVVGRMIKNATNAAKWMPHSQLCAESSPLVDQPSNSDDKGYPTNDHFSKSGRPTCAMRNASVRNPV